MKSNVIKFQLLGATLLASAVASADVMDRPQGFKIGERLTLKPYVSVGFTYDSNPDQQPSSKSVCSWTVNPALDVSYLAETWKLDFNVFYGYRAYNRYVNQLNSHNYGESLSYTWANAAKDEKGWTLLITEQYRRVDEDDNMAENNGRGLWRDRQEANVAGVLQRRITDKFHADLNASYNWLDYDNDKSKYNALFGWQRWVGGVQLGYAASKWTDFLIAGSYQRYYQDIEDWTGYSSSYPSYMTQYASESDAWTAQIGLASWMTERITYRALVGWSYYSYGDISSCNGFVYNVSLNWKMTDTWNMMLLADSHYQPSEREYGSAVRYDSVSWGLGKSLIRGKLTATLDLAYRHETREYAVASSYDYDEDIFSGRVGLNYQLNRFLAFYGNVEYQGCWFDGNKGSYNRDYNRFRGTVGFRVSY